MRLNLYWHGRDVIDIEAHIWRKRDDDDTDRPPTLTAAANLQDSSMPDQPMEYPDTTVRIGFGR